MKKKTLFTSFLTIVMCLCLTVGGTFALFTSSSEVDISVTSGNVNVKATASELDTDIYSGSATKVGNEITVERLVPGDSFSFDIEIENYSDVAVQYRTVLSSTDGGLFTALKVTITDGEEKRVYNGGYVYEDWAELLAGDADTTTAEHVKTLNVLVEFPDTGVPQNEYQGKSCTMNVLVEAVQGNATVVNPITKISDRHYEINDAKGLMLMKGIASGMYTGEGVNCKFELTDNIDMTGYAWSPIEQMWIDFEGNSYTISNLNCGTDSWGRSGFFGYLGGGSIKNLTLENVTAEGSQAGVIAGALEGTVENVTIIGNNSVKYNRSANLEELCGGVGAVTGVAQLVPTGVVIDGNVSVDYNNLVTAAYVKNELAQINDISSGVTVNGNVSTNSTITRGFIASNSTELASILDFINKGSYYNISLVNDPLTIVMKAGVYTGNYHLRQFPATDGSTIVSNYAQADKTFVTFLGEDGVEFKGYIYITGNGNGKGGCENYNPETKFVNVDFNGEDLPFVNGDDKYNIKGEYGLDNLYFIDCSFANTTHITFGGSGTLAVGDVAFTNCQFNNSGVISGGFSTITVTDCYFDGSDNGFVSAQRGGKTAGIVNVTNTIVKNCYEYGIRTNAEATVTVVDSTIEVKYNVEEGMGSLVFFRGKDAKVEFTNCNLTYDTLVSYKNAGVDATTTSITIDGSVVVFDSASLDKALKNGETTINLFEGEYVIPSSAGGKTLTINGMGNVKVTVPYHTAGEHSDGAFDSSKVTFNNITFETNSGYLVGYTRLSATYNNCIFNGTYTLFGDSEFNECKFNVSGDVYNIWTWGAPKATFNKCNFNSDGKALLLYGTVNSNLTVDSCTFNDKGGLEDKKAAIEIGNDYGVSYVVNVTNTTVNGYEINDKGINTNTTLWGNKNSMTTDKLSVTVDGVKVY